MPTKPPFPVWAKAEISRFREQADALQRALDMYLGEDNKQTAQTLERTNGPVKQARVSKYEPLFQKFGQVGRSLSMDEMHDIAKTAGFDIDRANLRSQVFAQKSAGRTRPDGDGYVWSSLEIEPAPSDTEEPV